VFYRRRIGEILLGSWRWTLNFLRRAARDEASRDAMQLAALIVLCTVIPGRCDAFERRSSRASSRTRLRGDRVSSHGVWLWMTRSIRRRPKPRVGEGDAQDRYLVAIAQFIAITPVFRARLHHRHGALARASAQKAAEFSFLISIPAIVAQTFCS
jgi:undecaprenyl pyrophosphate phosphatase UppP